MITAPNPWSSRWDDYLSVIRMRTKHAGLQIQISLMLGLLFLNGCATTPDKIATLEPLPPATVADYQSRLHTDMGEAAVSLYHDDRVSRHFGLRINAYHWIVVRTVFTNTLDNASLSIEPQNAILITKIGSFKNSKKGELHTDMIRNERIERQAYAAMHSPPAPGPYSMAAAQAQGALANGIMSGNTTVAIMNYQMAMYPSGPLPPSLGYGKLASRMEDCRVSVSPLPAHTSTSGFLYFKLPSVVLWKDISGVEFHVRKENTSQPITMLNEAAARRGKGML